MRMYDIIAKKRDGAALTREEIGFFVSGYAAGEIPDYQASALMMAVFLRGMNSEETTALTLCMAASGETVDLSTVSGVKVDKHSTGGVGDKTTLICGPIAASLGVKIAKMSGRGLGHTGGTVDKMEAIPGMCTALPRKDFLEIVRRVGICVVGQSSNLVPADKLLYSLRDVTATVESVPLIASSIMSKKLATGADRILLDVKVGSGAFMKTEEKALELARAMVEIGERSGRRTIALITDMDRPLGNAIGNALEIAEVCDTLQGRGPADLTELCVTLAANMLCLADFGEVKKCEEMARTQIENGEAFAKLKEMVAAQGGDISVLEDSGRFAKAAVSYELKAEKNGFLYSMNAEKCGSACVALGAGREKKDDRIDYAAGIILRKNVGDAVQAGETLAVLFSSDMEKCRGAQEALSAAITIGREAPVLAPLVRARVTAQDVN